MRSIKSEIQKINSDTKKIQAITKEINGISTDEMERQLRDINFYVGGLTDEAIKYHWTNLVVIPQQQTSN